MRYGGKANFNEQPTLLKITEPTQIVDNVNINGQVCRELLMYLNPIFSSVLDAHGVANLHCERLSIPLAGATKKDVDISGTFGIDKMYLGVKGPLSQVATLMGQNPGTDMALLPTKFELQNGLLNYNDMQINVGDNPVNFGGKIDIIKETYNLKVTLPYTDDGETVHVGEKVDNRISTVTKGRLKDGLDFGKILGELGEQLLKGKLKRGLKKGKLNETIKEKLGDYVDEDTQKMIEQGLENLFK